MIEGFYQSAQDWRHLFKKKRKILLYGNTAEYDIWMQHIQTIQTRGYFTILRQFTGILWTDDVIVSQKTGCQGSENLAPAIFLFCEPKTSVCSKKINFHTKSERKPKFLHNWLDYSVRFASIALQFTQSKSKSTNVFTLLLRACVNICCILDDYLFLVDFSPQHGLTVPNDIAYF